MRRPLAWCCLTLLIFLLVLQSAGESELDLPLLQTERILRQTSGLCDGTMPVTVTGYLTECSTLSSGVRLFMDHLTFISEDNSKISFLPQTKLTFITKQTNLLPGDFIRVSGFCTLFSAASNPGQFDERAYYFSKDTVCSLKKAKIEQDTAGAWSIGRGLYQIRTRLFRSFQQVLDEKTAGTISAILLGEKAAMDTERKALFQEGGIAHILAVSGLHITIIGMNLYRLLRKGGVMIPGAAFCSGAAVFAYAWMTGFGISAVRASVMFLIWIGAQISGRKYDQITAAALAAAWIVGRDAASLKEASFLLSFSAVLTLAVFLPVGLRVCEIRSALGQSLFSCLVVWMGTLPVTLYFFYQAAPWSIAVNLLIVPLMSVVMGAGLGAAAAELFSRNLGIFCGAPVHYLLYFFEKLCALEQQLPCAVWIAGRPSWIRIFLYYVILLFLLLSGCLKKKTRWRMRLLWMAGGICCLALMSCPTAKDLEVTCLDVGQGDAALITLPDGTACLIDGGSTSVDEVWQYRLEDAVKIQGIDTLDYIFLSHADQDHISGVVELLQASQKGILGYRTSGIKIGHLVLPPTADQEDFDELKQMASQKGLQVLTMQKDNRIEGSCGWSITALSPQQEILSGDKNEDSLVLMLQYGTFRMLFTGDLEGKTERMLAESSEDLRADVLKVGHHGSANSSSEAFLQQVLPKMAVISCGADNSYGHPAQETLQRLEAAGCEIFQTPLHGAVTIRSDGECFSVETCLSPEKG